MTSAAKFSRLTFWHQVSLLVSAPLRDGKFRNNNGTATTAIPSSSRRGCNYEHVSAVIAEWCPAATRPQRAARAAHRLTLDGSWWRNNWILTVSRVEFRPVDVVLRGCARRGIALEPFRLPNIAQSPPSYGTNPHPKIISLHRCDINVSFLQLTFLTSNLSFPDCSQIFRWKYARSVESFVFWETFCVGIWRGFGDGGRKEIWKIRSFLIIIIVNEKRGKEKKRGI